MDFAVVMVDCAEDRVSAHHNLDHVRASVDGRATIVVVQRAGIGPAVHDSLVGRTRAACFRLAVNHTAAVALLFTDSQTRVSPAWFGAAQRAMERGAEFVAGPVLPLPSPSGRVARASYLLDYAVHRRSPFVNAAGHPSANNFGVTRRILDLLPDGDLWKTEVARVAHRENLWAEAVPDMAVTSMPAPGLAPLLRDQYRRGRLHASRRCPTITTTERLGRVVAAPTVPVISIARIRRAAPGFDPFTGAIAVGGFSAWALGEAVGYATSSSGSSEVFG